MANSLSNLPLDVMSRKELCDLVRQLSGNIENHNKGCVAGLYIYPDFKEHVETIYPDNPDETFRFIVEEAQSKIYAITFARYESALSGAMRWEWSQEAFIDTKSSYDIRVL